MSNLPLRTSDLCVNDGAWGWVGHLPTDKGKEPAADALLYHHNTQLGSMTSREGPLKWTLQHCLTFAFLFR